MRLPSQIMTCGTALSYAQQNGERVVVTAGGGTFSGHVMEIDDHGVLLYDDMSHKMTVVKITEIVAVQTAVPDDDRPAIPMKAGRAYA